VDDLGCRLPIGQHANCAAHPAVGRAVPVAGSWATGTGR
jgi:hypothetical protein